MLMQVICNCLNLCLWTTALACGDVGSLHPIDARLLANWPAVLRHCREIRTSYRHIQDPYPELGSKKVTAEADSLTYADVRKIVYLYSKLNPQLQPNTIDALMWALQHLLISPGQFDGFMRIWTRPC